MLESLFDLPSVVAGLAIIVLLCLYATGGLTLVRSRVLPRLRLHDGDDHFSGALVHSAVVFCGLAVGLIAVSLFGTYTDMSKIISQEATALAVLSGEVNTYPEPTFSQLEKDFRDYLDYVIHEAWPVHQRSQIPSGGVDGIGHFQDILLTFVPATQRQKILHATGLPRVLWTVILVGALVSLSASFFLKVEDVHVREILVTVLAIFIGLVIFVIFALDRPS
jgi:hypothetical protein